MQYPDHRLTKFDSSVRTSFRVIGALISIGISGIYVNQATLRIPHVKRWAA